MGCRVGITTNLDAREQYWRSQYPNLQNWQVMFSDLTKKEAQNMENALAIAHTCDSNPGGDDPDDPNTKWHVYKFEY